MALLKTLPLTLTISVAKIPSVVSLAQLSPFLGLVPEIGFFFFENFQEFVLQNLRLQSNSLFDCSIKKLFATGQSPNQNYSC